MSVLQRPGFSPLRLVLAGLAIVGLAVVLASPSAFEPLAAAIDAAVELVGHDYVIVAALGVLAVLVAGFVLFSGRGAAMSQTEMPTVERPVPVPSAGEPFDEVIGGWRYVAPVVGRSTREAVRERLTAAAVAAVAVDEGCGRRTARRRVEDGNWTDDAVATRFLAGDRTSLGAWATGISAGETGPEYRARRTVEAILDRRRRSTGSRSPNPNANGSSTATADGSDTSRTNGSSPGGRR